MHATQPDDGPQRAFASAREPASASADQRLDDLEYVTASRLAYLSVEELLSELLERVRDRIGADTAAILLLDEERGVLVARAAKGIEEEARVGATVPVGRGFAGKIAAQRRPIVIEDVDHAEVYSPLLRKRGIKSLLGVPLLVDGGRRAIGVLHVGALVHRTFEEADLHLLQLVADRAALAIENARLSEQRSMTEGMQRALLPDALPEIPGLRLSARYLPAAGSVRVGGDWYDVLALPDGRVGFVIGDAVGHGIGAASVMAEVRTAVRAYAMERHPPVAIVGLANDLLVSMGRARSATIALAALDFELGELELVSAGHPPILLRRPDGSHEFVGDASGPPLGAFASAQYSSERLEFPDGGSLLLYTDGLVERRDRALDTGLAALADALPVSPPPGMGLADVALAGLDYDSVSDDVAILAVESLPLGGTLDLDLEARPIVLTGLRRAISRWLAAQGASELERFDMTLAVSEAAANAVEHAYGPRDARFAVGCVCDNGLVTVTVRDRGVWQMRPHDEQLHQQQQRRGRGLTLMSELTDEVVIDRGDNGTTVVLTKRLGAK